MGMCMNVHQASGLRKHQVLLDLEFPSSMQQFDPTIAIDVHVSVLLVLRYSLMTSSVP